MYVNVPLDQSIDFKIAIALSWLKDNPTEVAEVLPLGIGWGL